MSIKNIWSQNRSQFSMRVRTLYVISIRSHKWPVILLLNG